MKETLSNEQYLGQMYDLLCETGDQFSDHEPATPLDGLTYEHPRKGTRLIDMGERTLALSDNIYTQDQDLYTAFERRGLPTDGLAAAHAVVLERMGEGLVLGFSGYATSGYPYHDEGNGMKHLYDHLAEVGAMPSLVIDGGVSEGALGLSGVLARQYHVPSMGFIPRQGLDSTGPRDHLVIWGNTYMAREKAVGTVPDILICMGGDIGSRRECQAALSNGSSVLLLALKPAYRDGSFPRTYDQYEEMQEALADGRMRVCTSFDGIAANIDALLQNDLQSARAQRAAAIAEIFSKEQFELPEQSAN